MLENITELLDMGKYNSYIWPAYGVSILSLSALSAYIVRRNSKVRAELIQIENRVQEQKQTSQNT